VHCTGRGISVDSQLRTSTKNIYAAGDVIGDEQYTHIAAWQAFQATRNALFPGGSRGLSDLVPRVTFTDPEVAHVGPTREELRSRYGDRVKASVLDARHLDRAVCENDRDAFIRVMTRDGGVIVAATIVADRAGETLNELMVAMAHGIKLGEIANTIHAYPTNSTGVQRLAADMALDDAFTGFTGRAYRRLSKLTLRTFS